MGEVRTSGMLLDAGHDGTRKNAIFVGRSLGHNILLRFGLHRWTVKATKAAVKCVINI
jgi:hypothetical protein